MSPNPKTQINKGLPFRAGVAGVNIPTIGSQFSGIPEKTTAPVMQSTAKPPIQQPQAQTSMNLPQKTTPFGIGNDIGGIAGVNRPSINPSIQTSEFKKGFAEERARKESEYAGATKKLEEENLSNMLARSEEENKVDYTQEEFDQLPTYKQSKMVLQDKEKYIAEQLRTQFGDQIPAEITDKQILDDFYNQKPDEIKNFLQEDLDKVGGYIENVKGQMKINYKPYKSMTDEQKQVFDEKNNTEDVQFWDKFKIDTEATRYQIEKAKAKLGANTAETNRAGATKEEKSNYVKDYALSSMYRVQEGLTTAYNLLGPGMGEMLDMVGNTYWVEGKDGKIESQGGIKTMAVGLKDMVIMVADKIKNDPIGSLIWMLEHPAEAAMAIEGIMSIPSLVKTIKIAPSNVKSAVQKIYNFSQTTKTDIKNIDSAYVSAMTDIANIAEKEALSRGSAIDATIKKSIDKSIGQSIVGKKTKASVDQSYDDVFEGNKAIIQNKENLKLTDVEGNVLEGAIPETLVQWSESIEQTERVLVDKWKAISKEAGQSTDIPLYGVINDLENFKSNLPKITGEKATKYVNELITKLSKEKYMSIEEVEAEMVALNKELTNYLKNPQYGAGGLTDVDNQFRFSLRKILNEVIETVAEGPEYGDLKMQFKSIKGMERQVNQKMIVELRKNSKGLIDLPNIFIGGEFGAGVFRIFAGDIVGGSISLGSAGVMRIIQNTIKKWNSRDWNVKQLFQYMEKQGVGKGIDIERAIQNARLKASKWEKFKSEGKLEKPALPSPETVTPTNLGTPKNPIKAQGEVKAQLQPESKVVEVNPLKSNLKDGTIDTTITNSNTNTSKTKVETPKIIPGKPKPAPKAIKEGIPQKETIPQWKATVKAPEEPLIAEARKYKSADEFIKSKNNLFHGGKEENIKIFKKSEDSTDVLHFFSDKRDIAKSYGYVNEVFVEIKNPLKLKEYVDKGELVEKLGNEVNDVIKSFYGPTYTIFKKENNVQKLLELIKKKGYDGIEMLEYNNKLDLLEKSFMPLSDGQIKTKSQLKQIREEANKGIKPKVSKGIPVKK